MLMSDQDEDSFESVFDQGHWEWDDIIESLVFISDLAVLEDDYSPPTPMLIGSFEFKEDLDLMEQHLFRKRFQRKSVENDVIYLQDIKDMVLFTAPKALLSPALVNILHLPMTERFIRALLLYCQYFIQISDEMSRRILELQLKIRTSKSYETELEFRENLEDLRLLVAKEYSCIIMGSAEIAKYHHMGLSKKMRSLTKRDSILFESILRISIQIVWLALGRQSYNQIELEIHRLFKSEMYNIIEHKINTRYESVLSERELLVLYGHCVHRNRMINTYSPLNNEMHCGRDIDFRLMGLGAVKYPKLSQRLCYLERILTLPEETFEQFKMTLGILGLPRARFDTMLREIKMPVSTASSASSFRQSVGRLMSASRTSRVSATMNKSTLQQTLYGDIILPNKYKEEEHIPDLFPLEMLPKRQCNDEQRRKWMSYASLIMNKKNRHTKNAIV